MPSMRILAGKALWRRTAAAALAACGVAAAQDGGACATCPSPGTVPAAAPADLSQLYRDAYLNPGAFAPAGGYQRPANAGYWKNPSRIHLYMGIDYLRFSRARPSSNDNTVLTQVSNNIFFDTPAQQNGPIRALNAEQGAAGGFINGVQTPGSGSRNTQTQQTTDPLIQPILFPIDPTSSAQQRYTPNSPDARINVFENLVGGAPRMTAADLTGNLDADGYRATLGVVLGNGGRLEFAYSKFSHMQANAIDNVAGAGFLTKQISSGQPVYGLNLLGQIVLINQGASRFGFYRWGYLTAPGFSIPRPTDPTDLAASGRFVRFRGEEVRPYPVAGNTQQFGNNPAPPAALWPHFPDNELPQPMQLRNPITPIEPRIVGTLTASPSGLLPLRGALAGTADGNGQLSSDLPREPTTQDFPNRVDRSFIYEDGELAIASYTTDLQTGEILYRHELEAWSFPNLRVQLLGGMRVVNATDRFGFFFADLYGFSRSSIPTAGGSVLPPAVVAPANVPQLPFLVPNGPTPVPGIPGLVNTITLQEGQAAEETQVLTDTKISNNIVGPQIGIDARVPVGGYLDLHLMTKGGWMANFASARRSTVRGDGLELYTPTTATATKGSGVWEGQVGVSFRPHERVDLHVGYEWLGLLGVGNAIDNSLGGSGQASRPSTNGSIFFGGWYAGGQVVF